MAELKGSKTESNLMEAFAGESQANRKYLAFAEKADAEGQAQIARLFRAAAARSDRHPSPAFRCRGAQLYVCQRGGKNPCRPLPEGPGQFRQQPGRRLLCLQGLRQHAGGRAAWSLCGLRCRTGGVFQGRLGLPQTFLQPGPRARLFSFLLTNDSLFYQQLGDNRLAISS